MFVVLFSYRPKEPILREGITMRTSTRKKCQAYAAQNFLTLEVRKHLYLMYSVDLPEGLITESGRTGLAGENDVELSMPEIWGAILEDMETLVSEKWIINPDCEYIEQQTQIPNQDTPSR